MTMINGHELTTWDYCVTHLRAVAPISLGELRRWMVEQIPGVEESNVGDVCRNFINDAKDRRVIRLSKCDELGTVVDMNW